MLRCSWESIPTIFQWCNVVLTWMDQMITCKSTQGWLSCWQMPGHWSLVPIVGWIDRKMLTTQIILVGWSWRLHETMMKWDRNMQGRCNYRPQCSICMLQAIVSLLVWKLCCLLELLSLWPTEVIWSRAGDHVCSSTGVFVVPIPLPCSENGVVIWEITLLVGWRIRRD